MCVARGELPVRRFSAPPCRVELRLKEAEEQACRDLLRLALERGGTDNVTIVVGRARRASE